MAIFCSESFYFTWHIHLLRFFARKISCFQTSYFPIYACFRTFNCVDQVFSYMRFVALCQRQTSWPAQGLQSVAPRSKIQILLILHVQIIGTEWPHWVIRPKLQITLCANPINQHCGKVTWVNTQITFFDKHRSIDCKLAQYRIGGFLVSKCTLLSKNMLL